MSVLLTWVSLLLSTLYVALACNDPGVAAALAFPYVFVVVVIYSVGARRNRYRGHDHP